MEQEGSLVYGRVDEFTNTDVRPGWQLQVQPEQ